MPKFSIICVVLIVGMAGIVNADEQAKARAVLDRAIQATGGESVLSKFKAMRCKVSGTGYQGDKKIPLSYEWTNEGMNKMRSVSLDQDGKPSEIEVVNGKEGWVKDAGQDAEVLSGDQVGSRLEGMYAGWASMLVPLKEEGFHLSTLKEMDVFGRKAVGVLVRHDKHRPIKLYFDKETNLLVKYERPFKNVEAGKEVVEETLYSDFRDVQGTRQPFKLRTLWDSVMVSEMTTTEFQLYEKPLDEKVFSKP